MAFNDDEPIVALPNSGPRPKPFVAGKVQLVPIYNKKVPLEENNQKVLLELTGGDSVRDRPGLDLVSVLDISGSMKGGKLGKMKMAMQFVIKKLSPIDRLSIVTFSSAAARNSPLRQITEASKPELIKIINDLVAAGGTNIADGLRTGLTVLADRKLSGGRVVGVILMSDGQQNHGDAAQVVIGSVPVYTFGFGSHYDANVLTAIAKNSFGGTFSFVKEVDGLSMAFSQCLGGLLTVAAKDLKLTVARSENESIVQKVIAGTYKQEPGPVPGSVVVNFGDLYSKEVRKVIVDVLLPAVESDGGGDILSVSYTYIVDELLFRGNVLTLPLRRTGTAAPEDDQPVPEVQTEEARLKTVAMIKAARTMADGKNLLGARTKLVEAQNALEDVVEQSSPLVDMLKTELLELLKLMQSQASYEKEGRSYALSSETSHDLQRFAARGDIGSMRLFATPRMDKYLEQAKRFDQDPTAPLPSVDEDVKEEVAANPLGPIAGPITFYIEAAIQALQAIGMLINSGGNP